MFNLIMSQRTMFPIWYVHASPANMYFKGHSSVHCRLEGACSENFKSGTDWRFN